MSWNGNKVYNKHISGTSQEVPLMCFIVLS